MIIWTKNLRGFLWVYSALYQKRDKRKHKHRNAYVTVHVEKGHIEFAQVVRLHKGMLVNQQACDYQHSYPVNRAEMEKDTGKAHQCPCNNVE